MLKTSDGTLPISDEDGVDTIIDISIPRNAYSTCSTAGNTDAEVPLVMLIPLLRIPMRMVRHLLSMKLLLH
ncbi:hypothetical protein [Nonlabens tegetincola]|uniref:hypothetical protein n=1 Tax=Nonlabens tegetincola TaxID=323273 RepID=UPI0011B0BA45|nr:hypothetical protein [Nonlabens tegetincola]